MHRLLISFSLVFATCSAVMSEERLTSVVIPAGTQIKMYILGDVTVQNAHPGDSFQAQAASDVIIDGITVVRKGAEGEGIVSGTKHALTLAFDWVYAADGTKVNLSQSDVKRADKVASSDTPASSTLAAFGLAGYFGIVTSFVTKNVSVQRSTASAH